MDAVLVNLDATTTRNMADTLVDHGTDIGDERAVILTLNRVGFASKSISRLMDDAINTARAKVAQGKYLPTS